MGSQDMIRLPPPSSSNGRVSSWLTSSILTSSPFVIAYMSHPNWPAAASSLDHAVSLPQRPLRISVLTSSFNPPSRAHLALATRRMSSVGDGDEAEFDAHLLLFSTTNADKKPAPGETTALQRLDMMKEMAKEMERLSSAASRMENGVGKISSSIGNVAVGCVQEPTFVGQSNVITTLLRQHISSLPAPSSASSSSSSSPPAVHLSFCQGYDTLTRFFSPKYYPNNSMHSSLSTFFDRDGSSIVCARRGDISEDQESDFLASSGALEYCRNGKVELFDLDCDISSTQIRAVIKDANGDESELRESLKPLVVDGVADIIIRDGLYRA